MGVGRELCTHEAEACGTDLIVEDGGHLVGYGEYSTSKVY